MSPTAPLALATALLLAATGTLAADMPKRKPGLWQIETTMAAAPAMGPIKQCIDEKTDNFYQQLGEQHKDKCSESEIRNTGDKIVVHSVCRMGGSTATTDATFSGRFDSDYRGDIRVKYNPPMHGMSESTMTIAAKWLGPCAAGQKPGEMILPNGMKINPQQKGGARQ
ncbi:MAG: DUF3617 family protein [Sterolibacteriaceae bacterium]|nr:DUF3617 family protein [Candidatus Methylophosphatis haderslevensis]